MSFSYPHRRQINALAQRATLDRYNGADRGEKRMAIFFETADGFAAWLKEHGGAKTELVVGYHKRGSARPSMTWAESVDAALCFGWIDGVRKRIDEHTYQIRFTPRKTTSIWSRINIERVRILKSEGRMREAGLKAFAHRREHKSKIYSYEQRKVAALDPAAEARFRKAKTAWAFFEAQPPGYRQLVTWKIVSAKRVETRERRLQDLIRASKEKRRL
ncbi:MAG TPA: YdeI/OmpD-associated family protein [Steroidobacteraceae bacterium]|nr:YdeI/OmpD-associated family protein [Steroidobacteraceae bacterium]